MLIRRSPQGQIGDKVEGDAAASGDVKVRDGRRRNSAQPQSFNSPQSEWRSLSEVIPAIGTAGLEPNGEDGSLQPTGRVDSPNTSFYPGWRER